MRKRKAVFKVEVSEKSSQPQTGDCYWVFGSAKKGSESVGKKGGQKKQLQKRESSGSHLKNLSLESHGP